MKIYHNVRCRKSREALKIIESKAEKIEVIEYLKNPIQKKELKDILRFLKIFKECLLKSPARRFRYHQKLIKTFGFF